MNGTQNETRNHIQNELPLARPTYPPARPKKNRITSNPSPESDIGALPLEERFDSPEGCGYHRDYGGDYKDRGDDADD